MKMPAIIRKENRAPVAWAAILTFIAWNAFGFGWFGLPSLGFVTAGGAEQLATAKMEKVAVPLAAQLCAMKFNTQDSATIAAKKGKLQATQYTQARGEQLEKAWVILGEERVLGVTQKGLQSLLQKFEVRVCSQTGRAAPSANKLSK